MQMKISEVNTFRDFIALKDAWNDLLQRSAHTVFSTWEWLSTWWTHFGNNRRLIILTAEENNRLVGIAPLMYSIHSMFGLRQGKIEFIGTDAANPADSIIEDNSNINERRLVNYADFIIEHKYEKCLPLFFTHLHNLKINWSCTELLNIPANQDSLSRLSQVSTHIKPIHQCLHTPLPTSKEALLSSIKRKDRKEIRRFSRRIEKAGYKLQLCDCSEKSLVTNGMDALFALNQKRWSARGLPGAFTDPHLRSFYMDIAELFSRKNWLGLYCLKLSGKTVAALYGFRYLNKYVAYKTSMDPSYHHFSVGNLLFLNVMEKCIQEGLSDFDFMWGTDTYKKQWNTSGTWNYEAIIPKKRLFGAFKNSLYNKYWFNGNRVKYLHRQLLKGRE
jgi:CelD/BcsL family acetyltransferase involved in cellulose biosynthesis